jgi:hypothetical protein
MRGFGATQADVAIQRAFRVTEKVRLRRREWRINPLYQIGGPRSVQLALKIQF